ncbi:anthranilate synthase component I family protein [Plantactinospora sp. WMMB334]|uniref:anthranilate synthase component I family protein n=1 Tax=Plantactinospora sp. WMMB334 TaxID=3404119 RepID=UPI003B93D9AA
MPEIHVCRRALPAGATAEAYADALPADREFMLVDSVPVQGRPTRLLAVGALLRVVADGDTVVAVDETRRPLPVAAGPDPLARIMRLLAELRFTEPLPAPLRSAFGFLSYEAARGFEKLPGRHARVVPDYLLMVPRAVAAFDVATGDAEVVGLGRSAAEAARAADTLAGGRPPATGRPAAAPDRPAGTARDDPVRPSTRPPVRASFDRDSFATAVRRAHEYLLDGDIFQVVLSLRWDIATDRSGLDLYRRLVAVNPSPFQFCYRGRSLAVVGASPEPFVTLRSGRSRLRPLAGTRPRGRTPALDRANECELLGSEKEAAEHRMLVDLARNDLGRVCRPGSVLVDEVMVVERYSHVMHLVSNVVGQLDPEAGAEAVLRACFPAGTMTGAPKVRAMEIIDELEPAARGYYSGAVGLIAPDELDTYLTIRSAVLRPGTVSLQAGAGIVADSRPEDEYAECLAKLAATARALGIQSDRSLA